MSEIWLPRALEVWPIEKLVPYARNSRLHSERQIELIARSIERFGFLVPVLCDGSGGIIAGHGRTMAAQKLRMTEVPVVVGDHLSEAEKRAYVIADNKLAEMADWDNEKLASEMRDLQSLHFDLSFTGFNERELAELNPPADPTALPGQDECAVPGKAVTRPGDVWQIGGTHIVCCRDSRTPGVLDDVVAQGDSINLVVTSPPYAAQRQYDPNSGFEPVAPDAYVAWYAAVVAQFQKHLAADGSYFLNIKEHADGGQRHLYVKELTVAHVRQWGWKFIDEFCWRKTGVPGGWKNRFKNAWEPVFHFALSTQLKMDPLSVSHVSEGAFGYSSEAHFSQKAIGPRPGYENERGTIYDGLDSRGKTAARRTGLARPDNVIEIPPQTENNGHAAPFPVALPEFFIRAFSGPRDLVYDPFLGSGTTMVAAEKNGRRALGCEISPIYTDMILLRMRKLFPALAIVHAVEGRPLDELAAERGATLGAIAPQRGDFPRPGHSGPRRDPSMVPATPPVA